MPEEFTHEFTVKVNGGVEFRGRIEFDLDEKCSYDFQTYSRTEPEQAQVIDNLLNSVMAVFKAFGGIDKITIKPISE